MVVKEVINMLSFIIGSVIGMLGGFAMGVIMAKGSEEDDRG